MLGVSYGELFMLIASGAVLLGPKDLPVLARGAGQVAGRAAAWATLARTKFAQFSKDTEVSQLHEELTTSLQELRSLRSKLRSGVNVLDPGPMAQRLMRKHGLAEALPTAGKVQSSDHPSPNLKINTSSSSAQASAQESLTGSGLCGRPAAAPHQSPLPVSAVDLGLNKRPPGHTPTASSIMEDAMTESDIAHTVRRFMESQGMESK